MVLSFSAVYRRSAVDFLKSKSAVCDVGCVFWASSPFASSLTRLMTSSGPLKRFEPGRTSRRGVPCRRTCVGVDQSSTSLPMESDASRKPPQPAVQATEFRVSPAHVLSYVRVKYICMSLDVHVNTIEAVVNIMHSACHMYTNNIYAQGYSCCQYDDIILL